MSEESPLRRLARRAGVQDTWVDIWGEVHEIDDGVRRDLLRAMGLGTGPDGEGLDEVLHEEAERILPPVLVLREDAEASGAPLRIPPAEGSGWSWRILLEDGGRREGQAGVLPEDGEGRRFLPLPADLPLGYHHLEVEGDGRRAGCPVIVVPVRCHQPAAVSGGGRVWGPTAQLYGLGRRDGWGIGDYRDLRILVEGAAEAGAALVGVNPLHALFPGDPGRISPYSPSSRSFRNVLHLDVAGLPEFAECAQARERVASPDFAARLEALRGSELVDYAGVAAAKREILELCWEWFVERHRGGERGRAFSRWIEEGGDRRWAFGIFEALDEAQRAEDPGRWGWPVWPEELRERGSEAVRRFAEANPARVGFFLWLQWCCEEQLAAVGRTCLEKGLGVGLYMDLAVGVDGSGFETWYDRKIFAHGVRVGAPPDDFNLKGQDWGLPPWSPRALRAAAYEPFVACLRANMRHGGALRIDHVMGLMRLFWIPPGRNATAGTYVRYPFEEMLGILCLESRRNQCLVVGEDLGTVPDEVREAMDERGLLRYRLLYFSKDDGGAFRPPADYPREALVAVSTHDLPTWRGWWEGRDLLWRVELDLFPSDDKREEQEIGRRQDRRRLQTALGREGLLPEADDPSIEDLGLAAHRYLARTPAMAMALQLEDVLGLREQANLAGTVDEHPNWRRKLPLPLDEILEGDAWRRMTEALRSERGG